MKDKYNATGEIIEYYSWFAKYGIWILLLAFVMFAFAVSYAIRVYCVKY